jgi:hypothetical protein
LATHLPEPHWPAEEIVAYLRSLGSEENRAGMARFGINISTALGIGNSDLRGIARKLKRDPERSLALWDSGIREARLVAVFTGDPATGSASSNAGAGPPTWTAGSSSTRSRTCLPRRRSGANS